MIDGNRYKKCIAWHWAAGNGYACFEMCCEDQRNACCGQQRTDSTLCSHCQKVMNERIKASFKTTPVERFTMVELDKEFCSDACADAYGVGKERVPNGKLVYADSSE